MKSISFRTSSIKSNLCARVCFIVASLSFFSSPLSSASADEIADDVVAPLVSVDDLDEDQFRALASLAPVVLGSTSTGGNITNDVGAILQLLTDVIVDRARMYKVITLPQFEAGGNTGTLGGLLGTLMYEGGTLDWTPQHTKSFLFEIQRALYGQSGAPSASDAIQPLLLRMLGQIDAHSNVWTRVDVEEALLHAYNVDRASWGLLDEYQLGSHSDAWDVWIDDGQFSHLLSAVGGVSNSVDDLLGYLASGYMSVDLSPVTARQDTLQDSVDATYSVDDVAVHSSTADSYMTDDIETNALDVLTISPGDVGDLSPVLDLVDAGSLDVLPSLTGGDPVVEVFAATRNSNLPAFSVDFSLPPGFKTFIHAVAVWIWRILFFVAMWRLVSEEFGFWSTLGGSA